MKPSEDKFFRECMGTAETRPDWFVNPIRWACRRLCCWLGWHRWTWPIRSGDTLDLDAPPPHYAKCERCGQEYGPNAKERPDRR